MAEGSPAIDRPKPMSFALQGGGAHGAFTWGALDQLLADGRITIEAVSGTSAGAMNAVVLVDGFLKGGPEAARENLREFWNGVSAEGGIGTAVYEVVDAMMSYWKVPGFDAYGFAEQVMEETTAMSPFGANPLDINPLGELLNKVVDFERLRKTQSIQVFLGATNVRTGRGRIFVNHEITTNVVLASAALPHLFQAVHVEGEPYWDGGYVANPPLWPFFEGPEPSDVLLVQVNPALRKGIPETPWDVVQRESEIMFNTSLIKELRSIFLMSSWIEQNIVDGSKFQLSRLHRIDGTAALAAYSNATKRDTSPEFFETLRKDGERVAKQWLEQNFDFVGERSTADLHKDFVRGPALGLSGDPPKSGA
ncbi:MAG: patatin-like phospholipase family protein [Methyloceanibacter sp.]|nr:patatin-like phospholipase family protein [Methyloceanibacter sp.]